MATISALRSSAMQDRDRLAQIICRKIVKAQPAVDGCKVRARKLPRVLDAYVHTQSLFAGLASLLQAPNVRLPWAELFHAEASNEAASGRTVLAPRPLKRNSEARWLTDKEERLPRNVEAGSLLHGLIGRCHSLIAVSNLAAASFNDAFVRFVYPQKPLLSPERPDDHAILLEATR